jgi:serine/threonine-protein kinase
MGVVYLGHDTRLNRQVAIKTLPEHLAEDPERLARFEREAKTLAQLSHPNVAGIHAVEEHEGRRFLVMEFVEGRTLAERLDNGALPVEEALAIARQIAAGVESANESGIVHRDLKPGNVIVTADGKAKVLDFGLARTATDESHSSTELVTASLPAPVTREGAMIGTPAYMSPEQTAGRPVDRRSDVWAFGCMLFEMLTGTRPFAGNSSAEIVSAVLRDRPDLDRLPSDLPQPVRRLIRRCLEKDATKRLRDIGDAQLELEEALSELGPSVQDGQSQVFGSGTRPRHGLMRALALASCGAFIGAAVVYGALSTLMRDRVPLQPSHLSILLPHSPSEFSYFVPTIACSRDGRQVLLVSAGEADEHRIVLRGLDDPESKEVVVTNNPIEIGVISPDNKWVAYTEIDGWMRRASVDGGPPEEICRAIRVPGMVWGRDDRIIFSSYDDGRLRQVPANGGESQIIDIPVTENVSLVWPALAGADESVLLYACLKQDDAGKAYWIEAYDFESGKIKRLIDDATYPRWAQSGHLLFQRGSTLMAVELDLDQLEVLGAARPMLETMPMPHVGAGSWDLAENGTLFYRAEGALEETALVRANRAGGATPLTSQRPFLLHIIQRVHLDPTGTRIAFVLLEDSLNGRIGVLDIERDVLTPLPRATGSHAGPVWSADGQWIYYGQYLTGTIQSSGIYRRRADGTGEPEPVLAEPLGALCEDMSIDGRWLLLSVNDGVHAIADHRDIGMVDLLRSPPTIRKLTETAFDEWGARFSPDGNWIAYISDESGLDQVYIRSVASATGRVQVSREGGLSPVWSADGSEIYFGDPSTNLVMAVSFEPVASAAGESRTETHRALVGSPRALLPARSSRFVEDVLPGGEDLLMVDSAADTGPRSTKIDVVLRFSDLLAED